MLRRLVAAVVLVAGLAGIYRLVWLPYQCNVAKGHAHRRLLTAKKLGNPYALSSAGTRNVEELAECWKLQPTDPDLIMLFGQSLEAAERIPAAREVYCGGLQHNRSFARLFMACGNANLLIGNRDEALVNFVRVAQFAGPELLWSIDDGEVRTEVMRIAGERHGRILASSGELTLNSAFYVNNGGATSTELPGTSRSAASNWLVVNPSHSQTATELVRSDRTGGNAIRVRSTSAGAGLRQHVIAPPTAAFKVTAWVRVARGTACLQYGHETAERVLVCSDSPRWERLQGEDINCIDGTVSIIASSPGGADFFIDEVSVRSSVGADPCAD